MYVVLYAHTAMPCCNPTGLRSLLTCFWGSWKRLGGREGEGAARGSVLRCGVARLMVLMNIGTVHMVTTYICRSYGFCIIYYFCGTCMYCTYMYITYISRVKLHVHSRRERRYAPCNGLIIYDTYVWYPYLYNKRGPLQRFISMNMTKKNQKKKTKDLSVYSVHM